MKITNIPLYVIVLMLVLMRDDHTSASKKIRNYAKRVKKCTKQGYLAPDSDTGQCPFSHLRVGICCIQCHICPPGTEKDRLRDEKCFAPCVPCPIDPPKQYFSNNKTGTEECRQCIYCTKISRTLLQPCTATQDAECGKCLKGSVPISHSSNKRQPCTKRFYSNVPISPKLEEIFVTKKLNTSELPKDEFNSSESREKKPAWHQNKIWILTTIIIILVLFLVITVGILLTKRCTKKSGMRNARGKNSRKAIEPSKEEMQLLSNGFKEDKVEEHNLVIVEESTEMQKDLKALPNQIASNVHNRTFAVPPGQEINMGENNQPAENNGEPNNALGSVQPVVGPILEQQMEQNTATIVEEFGPLETVEVVDSSGNFTPQCNQKTRTRHNSHTDKVVDKHASDLKRSRSRNLSGNAAEKCEQRNPSYSIRKSDTSQQKFKDQKPKFARSFSEPGTETKTSSSKNEYKESKKAEKERTLINKTEGKDKNITPGEKLCWIKEKFGRMELKDILKVVKDRILIHHLDANDVDEIKIKGREEFAIKMGIPRCEAKTYENSIRLIRCLETRAKNLSDVADALYDIQRYDVISEFYEEIKSNPFFS